MKTLYNNYDINNSLWFSDFKEWCNDNNIDSTQYNEDSEYFIQWIYDTLALYWDDLMTNLEYDKENNVYCVVTGSVGKWNGRFEIEPKHFATLKDAIIACTNNCDFIVITEEKGAINIRGIHHDGTNLFTIHKLNEKGYDAHYEDKDLNNEEYFDIFNIEW